MDNCIFCKIVSGEVPAYKIYEDDDYLAFLDIFPTTEGYTLVIPKKHYRWVWDDPSIGKYFEVCQKIAKHFQKVTGKGSVYSMILGEEVPHAHVRMIPDQDDVFIKEMARFIIELRDKNIIHKLEDDEADSVLSKYKLD